MRNLMSQKMVELYGEKVAKKVFDRCESLGEGLNREIQEIAYNYFWSLPGLSIKEKSLVTIVSLITLEKEEQIKIHINGFINSGGTLGELVRLLSALSGSIEKEKILSSFSILQVALLENGFTKDDLSLAEKKLTGLMSNISSHPVMEENRDVAMGKVAHAVAKGVKKEIVDAIHSFVPKFGTVEDVEHTMIHQIVYCGFPTAMNGHAALKDFLECSQKKTLRAKL